MVTRFMVKRDFTEFEHNLSDGQIIDAFEDFCIQKGLIFSGKESYVIADGKTHYIRVENRSNKNRNKKSGWYVLDLTGDIAKGRCGWYHGDNPSFSWHLYFDYIAKNKNDRGIKFQKADELSILKRQEEREEKMIAQRLEEQLTVNTAKVYTAFEMWRSIPTTSHPYTTSKKIDPKYVRTLNPAPYTKEELESFVQQHYPNLFKPELIKRIMHWQESDDDKVFYDRNNVLIIPAFDFNMEYRTFQYILPKKTKSGKQKLFLGAPGTKSGSFHLIYGYDLPNPDRNTRLKFIVCEGWATGFALFLLTKGTIPIIVAWDAGNVIPVCRQLRNTYYSASIYICGDNDHDSYNKNLQMIVNAGLNHATRAAKQVGAVVAVPPFNKDIPEHKDLSDWDDYVEYAGFNVAQDALRAAMKTAIIHATYKDLENEHLHQPVKWSDRLEYLNHYAFPVSTCGFTRYLQAQVNAVRLGLNDSFDDQALDNIIRFNMEQTPCYDFLLEQRMDNPARNFVNRYINKMLSELESRMVVDTDIRSLVPDISKLIDILRLCNSELIGPFQQFIRQHCMQYNSEAWVDSVIAPLFDLEKHPAKLVADDIIQILKDQDIFCEIPHYYKELIGEPKDAKSFTKYWLWYLNLCFGKNTPIQLYNLTQRQFKEHFDSYIQTHPEIEDQLPVVEKSISTQAHQALDGSLHLIVNDLHNQMLDEEVEDIRFYEDQVLSGFKIFAKFPALIHYFKQEVIGIFSQNESPEWSKCVVENMWEKYLQTQSG